MKVLPPLDKDFGLLSPRELKAAHCTKFLCDVLAITQIENNQIVAAKKVCRSNPIDHTMYTLVGLDLVGPGAGFFHARVHVDVQPF